MSSPNSSFQNYESAVQDIEQEKKMVAALKRLSIGNMMSYDPDLPPMLEDIDSTYKQALFDDQDVAPIPMSKSPPSSSSSSSTTPSPPSDPLPTDASTPSPPHHKQSLRRQQSITRKGSITSRQPHIDPDRNSVATSESADEYYDAEDSDVLDPSSLLWVPANLHPQVNPDSFKNLVKSQVEEIMERKLSRKSSMSRKSSLSSTTREEVATETAVDEEKAKTSPRKSPENKRDSITSQPNRFSNPSLRDLTNELEKLTKMAGMNATDAVTLARTLSSTSLGYTDVEIMAFDEMASPPHTSPQGTSRRIVDLNNSDNNVDDDSDEIGDPDSPTRIHSTSSPPMSPPSKSTLQIQQRLQQKFQMAYNMSESSPSSPQSRSSSNSSRSQLQDFALKRSRRPDYRKHSVSSGSSSQSTVVPVVPVEGSSKVQLNHGRNTDLRHLSGHGEVTGSRSSTPPPQVPPKTMKSSSSTLKASSNAQKSSLNAQKLPVRRDSNSRDSQLLFSYRAPVEQAAPSTSVRGGESPYPTSQRSSAQIEKQFSGKYGPTSLSAKKASQAMLGRQDGSKTVDIERQRRHEQKSLMTGSSPYHRSGYPPQQKAHPSGSSTSSSQRPQGMIPQSQPQSHHQHQHRHSPPQQPLRGLQQQPHQSIQQQQQQQPLSSQQQIQQIQQQQYLQQQQQQQQQQYLQQHQHQQQKYPSHSVQQQMPYPQQQQRQQPEQKRTRHHYRSHQGQVDPQLLHRQQNPIQHLQQQLPQQQFSSQQMLHQQQHQSRTPISQQKAQRTLHQPYVVPSQVKSNQLSQNLDMLRSEINEFKESLNKTELPSSSAMRSHNQQPRNIASSPTNEAHDADFSFESTYQDLSYEDSLGIEKQVLEELGKHDGHHRYEARTIAGKEQVPDTDQSKRISPRKSPKKSPNKHHVSPAKTGVSTTPEISPVKKIKSVTTTPDNSKNDSLTPDISPIKAAATSTPLKTSPEKCSVEVSHDEKARDENFIRIEQGSLPLSSQVEKQPTKSPPKRKSSSPVNVERSGIQFGENDESNPFLLDTSKAQTPVTEVLHKSREIEPEIQARNPQRLLDRAAISDSTEEFSPETSPIKKMKKKASFGILPTTNVKNTPTSASSNPTIDTAKDNTKKIKKKKSWGWLRERSASLSSIDAQNLPPLPENKSAPSRSFSNPEIASTDSEDEDMETSPRRTASAGTHTDSSGKENLISKFFKKKKAPASVGNGNRSSASSIRSVESKESGVTVDYESDSDIKLVKKSTGLFKKKSKVKLLEKEREKVKSTLDSLDLDLKRELNSPDMEIDTDSYFAHNKENVTPVEPKVVAMDKEKEKTESVEFHKEESPEIQTIETPALLELENEGLENDEMNEEESKPSTTLEVQEKLKKSIKRTSKANQPIEFTDSAFGFPLPPPSQSTLIMLDYRFPVHVERAIYRLSHLKLANPKRSLREQVLLSNFMYAYLNLVDHTLHMEHMSNGVSLDLEEEDENEENGGQFGDNIIQDGDDEVLPNGEPIHIDLDIVDVENINTSSIEV